MFPMGGIPFSETLGLPCAVSISSTDAQDIGVGRHGRPNGFLLIEGTGMFATKPSSWLQVDRSEARSKVASRALVS